MTVTSSSSATSFSRAHERPAASLPSPKRSKIAPGAVVIDLTDEPQLPPAAQKADQCQIHIPSSLSLGLEDEPPPPPLAGQPRRPSFSDLYPPDIEALRLICPPPSPVDSVDSRATVDFDPEAFRLTPSPETDSQETVTAEP